MKTSIRFTAMIIPMLLFAIVAIAQPKRGSILIFYFQNANSQIHNATVTSVNGNEFTCRLSQTNSEYVFKHESDGVAEVVSSKGGKNPAGTVIYYAEYFAEDAAYDCVGNKEAYAEVAVKFPDGKTFLGYLGKEFSADGNFEITFWHSMNTYVFNKDGLVVSKTGGVYGKGTFGIIYCVTQSYVAPQIKPKLKEQKRTNQ
ncbi:MAG: hypothetical protein EOP53_07125 [Sphingobacteriales bacterium]|nr:MAG: hypothetical protein EOP53_07125 [Sphingobacteriales bacterium]